MTNRVKSLTVVLDQDIREDDVEGVINAIGSLRHVIAVDHSVTDPADYANRARIRHELSEKLWEVLYPKTPT